MENFMYRNVFSRIEVVQEGREPLPLYNLCGMHMSAGCMINHQRTQRCDRINKIRWQRREGTIASRYMEASLSLTGEDKAECIEGAETFKYLGRMLEQSDEDWPEVRKNVDKACQVWSQLGKLLRREGAELQVSAMFYRAVVQSVLLFG